MSTPLLSPNSISTIRYDRKNHRKMIKHSLPSEINALPTDWTPNTKPSKIIENLLADKQKLHDQRLSDLKDVMIKIKVETENKIRNASENVKQCIFNTKKYVEEDMEKYTFDFNKTKATIRSYEEMFKRLKEMIAIRCNEMKLAITKHDSQLKQIELERMNSLKAAFRSAYEDLTKISYKLPHELQLYFENEIMLLNQMTLSNHYAYSELQSQLMNIALSNENIWLKKVDKLKFDYQRKYEEQQRNKDKYSSGDDIDDGVLTLLKVKAFTENLTMEIFQLESEGQGATNMIYKVLKRIYEGRFDEVHMIETDFVGLPKRDFWGIYDEVYRSMFEFESYEKVTEYTEVMMGRWRDVVDRLADEVEFCKQAVVKGLHIWDQHFVRQLEVTDIFSMDLWDLINTSDDDDDITMAALNKTIDTMRMGPNEDSLNKLMGDCKSYWIPYKNHLKKVIRNTHVISTGFVI
ncbi:uncharacterized protein [Atheta coriaria]|uniref:uncharacterized protein n=1 Tax=Dalotia coriaria TaxID=877792 RepID=UPI0031F46150